MTTTSTTHRVNLNILSTYAPSWALTEGLRELVANTFDEKGTLVVSPGKAIFTTPTVPKVSHLTVIGYTTKSDKPSSIGQFGEGFKVGVNAILRLGGSVTVRASNWTMKLSHESPTDDPTIRLLTATVTTNPELTPLDSCEVVVKHPDITKDQVSGLYTTQPLGPITKPSVSPARIYCKGMHITTLPQPSVYDYNLELLINRDRTQVNPFDLNRKLIVALSAKGVTLAEIKTILTNETLLERRALNECPHHLSRGVIDTIREYLTNLHGKKFVLASRNDHHNTRAARKGYAVAFLDPNLTDHLVNYGEFETSSSSSLFSESDSFTQRTVDEKIMVPLNDLMDTVGVSVPVVFFEDTPGAPLGKFVTQAGRNTVFLNERLLAPGQKTQLYATFLHELAHSTSGAGDCTEAFEEGLTNLLGILAKELLRR